MTPMSAEVLNAMERTHSDGTYVASYQAFSFLCVHASRPADRRQLYLRTGYPSVSPQAT